MPQTTTLLPEGRQRYFNNDGTPAAGGKLWTYAAGTSALKATYSDADGTVANANPITLDAKGEAVIYWTGAYKVDLRQADGLQVTGYPVDNLRTDPAGLWGLVTQLAASTGATLIKYGADTLAALFKSRVGRVVDSVAELRALDPSKNTRAFVTGYYAAGDGGGGSYFYDAAGNPANDNGGTILAAVGGGCWRLAGTGLVSARQFGAKGDDVTDDTAVLNKWLAYLTAGAGLNQHRGYWPAGTYRVSGAGLLVAVADTLPGMTTDGAGSVVLKGSIATLITFNATGGSGMLCQVEWDGIKLDGVANTGTNEGVRVTGLCFFMLRGWHFYRLGRGIRLLNDKAGSFTEGVIGADCYFDTSVTTWLQYSKNAGDGSFRNSGLLRFRGNLGATAGPAILIDAGCVPYMGPMDGTIWNFNPAGVFIRNNSTQVPMVGTLDTETQGANTNALVLVDTAGSGFYVFLHGAVLGWNYGSSKITMGKMLLSASYLNTNDGLGQIFLPNVTSGQVTSTALGQRLKAPVIAGVSRPFQQWSAILTVCVTAPNGYYWQGMYTVLPGSVDAIINANALPGGGIVNNAGTYGAVTVSQGNDSSVWFDNPNLPAGAVLSYSFKYQHGLISQ
jgi:hypothetical protein